MYNNYGAPPFARPPGYGGPPPGMGPPGMGPPPGTPATPTPPGVPPSNANLVQPPTLGGPRPLPPHWQTGSMPNINFSAPVIRLGPQNSQRGSAADSTSGRRDGAAPSSRRGLGMDSMRDEQGAKGRDTPMILVPPTREEIARTIFVGNIPEGVGGDEGMERILASAGNLRRWTRATDANNRPQTFGFAEYEDAQSLETAAEIFKDVLVPTKRQEPDQVKEEDGKDDEVKKTKLQVMVDDASVKYAEEWKIRRGDDENTTQFRIDQAREQLSSVLASLFNPPHPLSVDSSGDMIMRDMPMQDGEGVEVVQIPFSADDELADIPEEMREIVAAEIAAFRDRSNQRDQARLQREEELEEQQRRRDSRRSPPPSAPTGPGGVGANGVPLGPRAERGPQGAPSGPKGSQFPRDYQSGVSFVNGGTISNGLYLKREDEDDSASDSEIEQRRQKKRDAENEEKYKRELSQWLKAEARTANNLERTTNRMKNQEVDQEKEREAQARYLAKFVDDLEAAKKAHLYYRDHSEYVRERTRTREREARDDAKDRAEEQREIAAQQKRQDAHQGRTDTYQDVEIEDAPSAAPENQPFKLSLGAATKKIEKVAVPHRTVAEVENLLEDEELVEAPTGKKRTLIPINFNSEGRANLTTEEVVDFQRRLAAEIPSTKDGLFAWDVSWEHLLDKNIDVDIRQWAENKVLDLLGMQEDLLVEAIVQHLRNHGDPQTLVKNLEIALDDEAESLVKKLWRMVVYYSEIEKRGIK